MSCGAHVEPPSPEYSCTPPPYVGEELSILQFTQLPKSPSVFFNIIAYFVLADRRYGVKLTSFHSPAESVVNADVSITPLVKSSPVGSPPPSTALIATIMVGGDPCFCTRSFTLVILWFSFVPVFPIVNV